MPVKSKSSAATVETVQPARKPRVVVARQPSRATAPRLATGEMLREIHLRNEQLSSEIKELLVRLG